MSEFRADGAGGLDGVPASFPLLPPDRIRLFDTPLLQASILELKPMITGLNATLSIHDETVSFESD